MPKLDEKSTSHVNGVAADQLKSFVERIERLEEEKAGLAGDIREVYAEAKGNGFDTKAIRKIIALRRLDEAERREQEAILELYMQALGMLADTPLGQAAVSREASTRKRGRRSLNDEIHEAIVDTFRDRPDVTIERNARL